MSPLPLELAFGHSRQVVPLECRFDLDVVLAGGESTDPLVEAEIKAALDRPIGSPPVGEIVQGASRVLVVVSDPTRSTGSRHYLPGLVRRIRSAGVENLTFAVASGLHRSPTAEDIETILGPELANRYPAVLHDPDDDGRLVPLGRTSSGTPVTVHAAVTEHDRIILTGSAGFHYYAGFSGGRKALVPGLAGRRTIVGNHLRALRRDGSRHPRARAGVLAGNPVHRDMVEGAAMVEPSFLVNSVMRAGGGIEQVFAGNWRRAHEAASRYLRRSRRVIVTPRRLVVVSAGGHPADIDVIQSHKAFEAVFRALSPGGVLILVAACTEGAGHPDFMPCFDLETAEDLLAWVVSDYRVYRQTALAWRRKAESCRLIMVSDLGPEQVRKLGAEPANDLEGALRIAENRIPGGTRGWVFPLGSRLLVEASGGRAGRQAR